MSSTLIIGVDEVGRGCLAGPVVVSACCVLGAHRVPGITDSKKLTEKKRAALKTAVFESGTHKVCTVHVPAAQVDALNVLGATMFGMRATVAQVLEQLVGDSLDTHVRVLIDGNHDPWAYVNETLHDPRVPLLTCETVVRGDSSVYEIGVASIVAKCERDTLMTRLHADYPQYGWASNKGYPSAAHRRALETHGPCTHHRRTFGPVARAVAAKCIDKKQ